MQYPRIFATVLCVCIAPVVTRGQNPVNFLSVTSTVGETPANIYPVDLNNDGLTDIVQDSGQSPSGFTVNINTGNGTFAAPTTYTLPINTTSVPGIATGDFNRDGKVDIAALLPGTNEVAIYLGNGNGTFQSPRISTIALPSGYLFAPAGAAAADFNADGNIDLATWTYDGYGSSSAVTELYVLQGNGTGGFNATPHAVLASTSLQPAFQIFVGDFDSDAKADIAAITSVEDYSTGATTSSTVHVLYGSNDFTFEDTTPYTASNYLLRGGTADVNSDGYTDFYVLQSAQVGVFYGNSSRTFDSYFTDLSSSYSWGSSPDGWNWAPELTVADFNGDGLMDLAILTWNPDTNTEYVDFLLAGTQLGQFTSQLVQLPVTYLWETSPVAGLFSGSYLRPDLTLNQSPNGGSPPQNAPSYLTAELNEAGSGFFAPCFWPKSGEGFNVCSPGTSLNSSSLFSATVNSFGKLRKIELWVDGVKVQEQHHTWDQHAYFEWAGIFSPGTHQATFFAADVDDRLQRYDFTFTN